MLEHFPIRKSDLNKLNQLSTQNYEKTLYY